MCTLRKKKKQPPNFPLKGAISKAVCKKNKYKNILATQSDVWVECHHY